MFFSRVFPRIGRREIGPRALWDESEGIEEDFGIVTTLAIFHSEGK